MFSSSTEAIIPAKGDGKSVDLMVDQIHQFVANDTLDPDLIESDDNSVDLMVDLIHQFDGNDTVEDDGMNIVGLTEAEIYALDPDLIETGYTVENDQNINYGYTVNKDNQMNRLRENAKKDAYDVTYKDFKTIAGSRIATNANIEFNAGLYMSAIKPALLAVHEGWKTVLFGTSITCNKISNRMDKTGKHLVCT